MLMCHNSGERGPLNDYYWLCILYNPIQQLRGSGKPYNHHKHSYLLTQQPYLPEFFLQMYLHIQEMSWAALFEVAEDWKQPKGQ